jgi:hypothetical protein
MDGNHPADTPTSRKPRWYAPTPAKFLFAVLVMQGVLFLSAHYRWFWFNERKGYTVLITLAATAVAFLLLVARVLVSRLFKSKLQFGLATLLLVIVVVAIPFQWMGQEVARARQQKLLVEMREPGANVSYIADVIDPFDTSPKSDAWLVERLGKDFFYDVAWLELSNSSITDADMKDLKELKKLESLCLGNTRISDAGIEQLKTLTNLKFLGLYETGITDAGLRHLKEHSALESLLLNETHVTKTAVQAFQKELPNCFITHTHRKIDRADEP